MKNKQIIHPNALFLIDGSYLLYRSYFAIKPLSTSTGIPTNAVYGFCRAIKKLIDTFNPSFLGIVWDTKGGSFRNKRYPAYKAHRPPAPADLIQQKEIILNFITLLGIKNVLLEGYEADDLLATLARQKLGEQTAIVCADKDMYQLLEDPSVAIVDLFKERIFDAHEYTQDKGFAPHKIPFYHALIGDASDNIPGVKGIGEKSATELVLSFNSLDDLYENLSRVTKTRILSALTADKENAYLSLELFSLANAPLNYSLESFRFNAQQWTQAQTFFQTYEFSSLIGTTTSPATQAVIEKKTDSSGWKTVVVNSQLMLTTLVNKLKNAAIYSLDTETNALGGPTQEMVGISFCIEPDEAFYIPFTHPTNEAPANLHREDTLKVLKETLENPLHKKTLHHAKFDAHVLARYGITLQGVAFDSLIAANLVKESAPINLKDLSMQLLQEKMETYEEIVGKQYKHFGQVPLEKAAHYAAHDARQTLLIMPLLEKKLASIDKLEYFFHTIDLPFADLLFRMEQAGILLDSGKIEALDKDITEELELIESKLTAAMPTQQLSIDQSSVNFNSPKQIEYLLFEVLKLPASGKTAKGSRSTDQEVLEKLSHLHFIPGLILKYRELTKLKNTYTQPLPKEVNPATGRIHTTFSQTLVATGRLSSSNPNLQNIPTSSSFGNSIRGAFVAAPNHVLLSADYSQIELRILAHISSDPALCQAFHLNQDIHIQTAAQLLHIPQESVTPEQRQLGKQLNFSIMYGLTPYGLAQDMNISVKEAKSYIDGYFETYSHVKAWMDKTVAEAKISGFVTSLWGRRRYIQELQAANKTLFDAGRRVAINTPIQGSAADLMKVAMLEIDTMLKKNQCLSKILLQIHDEIILEIPNSEIDLVESIVQSAMENAVQWQIPLKVALRRGKDWGEITK